MKQNPKQVEEALEDHSVCVYLQQTRKHDDGQTSFRTYFACCLGCGQHSHTTKHAFRFLHEQWCEKCRAPFNGTCEGCLKHSTRKQYTETNKCDEFIRKHEASCGGKWDDVAPWFNLKVAAPKLKIAARKTERKMVRKTLAAPKAKDAAAVAPVAAPVVSGLSENDVRDMIAKRFPNEFSKYFYEADEEDIDGYDTDEMNDHHEAIADRAKERAIPIPKILDSIAETLLKIYNEKEALKAGKKPQNDPEVFGLKTQIKQMENELITKNDKITALQTRLESCEIAARKTDRLMSELRNQNTQMMELLKSNNIEYNPY